MMDKVPIANLIFWLCLVIFLIRLNFFISCVPLYVLPVIYNITDAHKLIPEGERISVQDIVSHGEWEIGLYREGAIRKEYETKKGVYKMRVFTNSEGRYMEIVEFGSDSIDRFPASYKTVEDAVTQAYRTVVRHYNTGEHSKGVIGDELLDDANSVGKERDHGDGETGEVVE